MYTTGRYIERERKKERETERKRERESESKIAVLCCVQVVKEK
jgi:hypothetical protein